MCKDKDKEVKVEIAKETDVLLDKATVNVLLYRNDEKHKWQVFDRCGPNLDVLEQKLVRMHNPKFVFVAVIIPE